MFSLRSTQAHSGRMGAVAGPLCLVAEDEALIAMGLAADCDDAGLEIVGPFASCAQALDWVEEHTPDIALLDVRLKDGPCTALARTLVQRGVPVVIYSGVLHHGETPPDLRDLPWIEKPVEGEDLLRALVRLVPLDLRATVAGRRPAPQAGRDPLRLHQPPRRRVGSGPTDRSRP